MNKRRQMDRRKNEDATSNSVENEILEALPNSPTCWKRGKCFSALRAVR